LSFDKLDANKDFLYQFDYRRVYDELMTKWFKTETTVTKEILGNRFDIIETGLFSSKQVLSSEPQLSDSPTIAYPNPTTDGFFNLKVTLEKPSDIAIQLVNIQGFNIAQNTPNRLPAGTHSFPMYTGETKGIYLVNIQTDSRREILKVVRV
jgi:hypothetical protein